MMRITVLGLAVITFVTITGLDANIAQQPGPNEDVRFVAELSDASDEEGGAVTLHLIFFGAEPAADVAEKVLRNCLLAAAAIDPANDVTGHAWFSVSRASTDRRPITLPSGSTDLVYDGASRRIGSANPSTEASDAPAADPASGEGISAIAQDSEVQEACGDVNADWVASLVAVAAENAGGERKHIVKALRAWCKDNSIKVDRRVRACLSAISKAANAAAGPSPINPEDLAEAIERGKSAYDLGQCAKCHLGNGQGGPRGPDLTDQDWLHCDGSIAGIRNVLISGVPQNKIKDATRTFGMNPATELIPDDEQITDLAAYIHSLSQQ